jgi:prevent-host-death family protein
MSDASRVKPISYLKAHAAEILADLADRREPILITQNGEARAVIQDVASFEQTRQTLALLKLLALGMQDMEAGRTRDARDVVDRLRSSAKGH